MRPVKAIFADDTGMTLAEVIVAVSIIMVGLVALIGAMPLGTSQIGEANLKTTATFLAQQRMEQIKNATWTITTPCPGLTSPAGCDGLGGAGSDGTAAVSVTGFAGRWPDEAYGSIAFPGANCAANDRSGGCRFRRQVRITDCSVASCAGIGTGTATVNTLRQVAVIVFFSPLAGTGIGQSTGNTCDGSTQGEECVKLTTLIAERP
jgi:type II secretory pathway pseudopilin PulG